MLRKTIIVSGGSRGLGSHIVEHLLTAGHIVGTFARRATDLTRDFAGRFESSFSFLECDANDTGTLSKWVEAFRERHERIDGLVNNAAIGQDHLLVHTSPEIIHRLISTNLEAPILLTRLVLKHMLLQESGGRIVNISSICGTRGYPGLAVYSATKGAMDAFTRAVAHEVGGRGILVNSVAPGFFESDMSSVLAKEQLSTIKRRTPTSHLTSEKNLMPVIQLLLLGDTNITGQTLIVDGGVSS
jgi:3-oxoacyl-[acyl-carrier protein] reductase